ncbi:uncharacterized protein LOC125240838 [Leguminivora glycinivorella]|uniref:uncharacterized protein LOC125240838 n=1 Tax=Leguminivora glycinivorella TaxID=1035111 RepID=UPI00200E919A|nr:uncharacterized protein LOC125240838 [Leguminivora glycinivorella]
MGDVTLEFLQELLKDDYPDVTIQDFEGAPGTKRGDNYTSMVFRIQLKGIQQDVSGETVPWSGSIIYKCLPDSIERRKTFKSEELFCNEVAFYNKIWPALDNFQRQRNIKSPFKAIPKCYLAQDDLVILKDLKQQGFVMPDRRQGLTIEQCYFVLKNLSQFHALSLAMKHYNPEAFYDLIDVHDGITEVLFSGDNEEYYKSYYREAMHNALDMVEEGLADSEDKEKYLSKFREFCSEDTFFQMMVSLVTPREPLAVINHGDCWTNNFLFRYVDGDIAEMVTVDFQLVRYSSPTVDLAYLLYLCLSREQRTEHLPSLLEYYTEELHKRLVELSDDGAAFMDKKTLNEMFQEEFHRSGKFGLGVALDMYPIMTCNSNEAPNVYQAKDSEVVPTNESTPVSTLNAACRKKMTDLVRELVDGGVL